LLATVAAALALAGLFAYALYDVALNRGQLTASAGAASLIIASIPIFTALLAVTFSWASGSTPWAGRASWWAARGSL
jgi:drug/metabolite transporter (DMT)-like permease